MKSLPKLIRRYVGILLLSCILLLAVNLILLVAFVANQVPNASPWKTAEEVAGTLQQTEGGYSLPDVIALTLKEDNVWGIYIDNETKQVAWQTDNLPENIPLSYSLSDVVRLTRGYIDGYPTFTGEAENGIVVLGYPRESFWKHMWPSWGYDMIANLPKTALSVLAVNMALVFLIYVVANTKLLKSVQPIVRGIQGLSSGEYVSVREKGLLSELAVSINRTSEILQSQNRQLRRRETARANWIAGVSHDIRTPLSMVMGYAGQLAEDPQLANAEREKAEVIVRQSKRMRNLINDLNLASKLEYNMQPVNLKEENMVALVRQVVVDFINMDIDDRHPLAWETDEALAFCPVNADRDLVRRAVGNLIQNSISHNEEGCNIYVCVTADDKNCNVVVADDGVGADDSQIEKLNHAPHYMVCDENLAEQRHGLGLLIVKQIAEAHGGAVVIGRSPYGGFSVKITVPVQRADGLRKTVSYASRS